MSEPSIDRPWDAPKAPATEPNRVVSWMDRHKALTATGLVVLVLAAATIGTALGGGRDSSTSTAGGAPVAVMPQTDDSLQEAVFSIEGTASSVDITLGVGNETSQQSGLAVPVTVGGRQGLRATAPPGTFLYIAAQNMGETGSVTCTITVDGTVISTTTSRGAYVIATCSGTS